MFTHNVLQHVGFEVIGASISATTKRALAICEDLKKICKFKNPPEKPFPSARIVWCRTTLHHSSSMQAKKLQRHSGIKDFLIDKESFLQIVFLLLMKFVCFRGECLQGSTSPRRKQNLKIKAAKERPAVILDANARGEMTVLIVLLVSLLFL